MFKWFSTLRDYATAAGDDIPVLRPESEHDRARWHNALLRLYAKGPDGGADGRRRLVVACGPAPLPVAHQLARRTEAALLTIESPAELSAAVRDAEESNVVVLALAAELRISLVTELVEAAAEGKRLGFLSGRTVAGLSFSAAKALLSPRSDLRGIDDYTAPGHHLDHAAASSEQVVARITRPTLAKVIHAHGEGSHAKLPGVTVCGLLDELEFPSAPHHGCSRLARRCKRAQQSGVQVVFGDELPAPLIGFVCCNGFNFAAELYPSPVALALSLVEGYAAAVITPIRPLIASDEILAALRTLLGAGTPIGEVTHRLNQISAEIGQPTTFACHGDPCFALPRASAEAPQPATEQGDGEGARAARAALRVAPRSALPELQGWLVRVLRDLERGRRLLRSVDAWLGRCDRDLTRPTAAVLERLERLTLYALKRAEAQRRSIPLQALRRATVPIRLLVARWDKAAAHLLLSLRDRVDPFDVGHYDQVLMEMRRDSPCGRCGTPLEIYSYGAQLPATERRTAVLCSVCGPVREHRASGIRLRVLGQTEAGSAGDELFARLGLDLPERPLVSQAAVSCRFFDKARDQCIEESVLTVPAKRQTLRFRFRLPGDLSHDLHTIRFFASCGFDTAYARLRFAFLPATGAVETAGGSVEADRMTLACGDPGGLRCTS